jgi:hypothetical protein
MGLGEVLARLVSNLVIGEAAARAIANPTEDTLLRVLTIATLNGTLAGWAAATSYLQLEAQPPARLVGGARQEAERLLAAMSPLYGMERPAVQERIRQLILGGTLQGHDSGSYGAAVEAEAGWKTWTRIMPRQTSRDHGMLNGASLPRDALFTLPNGKRVFGPRDWARDPDPGEWVNCGHGLVYSHRATAAQLEQALKITPRGIPYPEAIRRGLRP